MLGFWSFCVETFLCSFAILWTANIWLESYEKEDTVVGIYYIEFSHLGFDAKQICLLQGHMS